MPLIAPAQSRLEAALDAFERDWSTTVKGIPSIEQLLATHDLGDCPDAITEVIRVEIDRLCSLGADVNLRQYFDRFPCLKLDSQHALALAFEDFRSRWTRGYSCRPDRWEWIPQIQGQGWFASLPHESTGIIEKATGDSTAAHAPSSVGAPVRAGQRLGEFELLSTLGTGAFSTVFLARQHSLEGRYVAVKVVNRPMREPAHLARLLHSGIVPLYSYHRIKSYWVLCMPYAGSVTLADWQASQPAAGSRTGQSLMATVAAANDRLTVTEQDGESDGLTTLSVAQLKSVNDWNTTGAQLLGRVAHFDAARLALWMFRRLSSALAHAHLRGIVHGDLKPANVLVRHDGEPALIDFNLSHGTDVAVRSWVGGTLPYMAPEQLRALCGLKCETGTATDVYSLGAVIYEFAEGKLPFSAPASPSCADLEAALTQRQRGLPLEFDSRITAGLKSILRKCLAPDLSDRYPSAVELAEDVEREEQNLPLLHAREGLWSGRIAKLTRRNPRTFSTTTTAFIAAIMVLALLMGLTRYRGQAQRLAATQSYARFIAGSDRALTSYLTADSEYEDRAVRMNLTRSAFDVFELNGTTERTNWRNGVRFAKLTAEEQDRVDERLFVLASLAVEDAWDPESTASTGVDQEMLGACRQVFESLPAWSRDTTTYRLAARRWESTSPERRAPLTLGNLAASPAAHPADRLVCAIALIGSERFDDVLRLLDEPKLVQSLGVVYWLTAGRAQLEKGDLRDAVLSFTFAIGNMPGGVAGYFNRGLAHFRLGELEAAKRDFTSALKLESRFAPALVNRSFCHAASSDHELALADLNAALELTPRSNRLLLLRSRQLKQLGREAEGRQDFDEALRASPQSIQDYVSLGLAWLPDDPRQSLAVLQRAERRYGVHPMILQSQAHVYSEHLNEPAGALEALNRLLDESPLFLKALAGRGVLLARRENVEGALADAQRVESQSRVLPAEIVYQLACVYALGCKTRPELSRPALRRLAEALRRGYGAELLDSDPDLAEVRGLSAFQSLRSAARLFSER